MPDYIYENPPLVEVIAEVHWKLEPLSTIPNAAIDPHFKGFSDDFSKDLAKAGYGFVERLIPQEFPLELVAHRPLLRFRAAPDTWPVYQLGPGIFTANLVPPYKGWADFRKTIEVGLRHVFATYPNPDRYLKLEKLELRYVDAFTKRHGFESYSRYVSENLRMKLQVPPELSDKSIEDGPDSLTATLDIQFPLRNLKGCTGEIKFGMGTVKDDRALVGSFAAKTSEAIPASNIEAILPWFDAAHGQVREWFEWCITDAARKTFGKKIEIAA